MNIKGDVVIIKVYLVQRDDRCENCSGLNTFAVSSDLNKCRQICIDDIIETNKQDNRFNIDNCSIGNLEKNKYSNVWELGILVNISWEVLHTYEIREKELL